MTINIIAAINNTYSIGNDGKLLFRIKSDLQRFKRITSNSTVIMGRKTFDEIGAALPNRRNLVLSRNASFNPKGVEVISSFQDVLEQYTNSKDDIYIIGGQDLFNQSVVLADKVYLTLINDDTYGDRIFPYEVVKQHFKVVSKEIYNENGYEFEFIDYIRKG